MTQNDQFINTYIRRKAIILFYKEYQKSIDLSWDGLSKVLTINQSLSQLPLIFISIRLYVVVQPSQPYNMFSNTNKSSIPQKQYNVQQQCCILKLNVFNIGSTETFASHNINRFQNLKALILSKSSLKNLQIIPDLPNLIALDVSYNFIKKDVNVVRKLERLIYLNLCWNVVEKSEQLMTIGRQDTIWIYAKGNLFTQQCMWEERLKKVKIYPLTNSIDLEQDFDFNNLNLEAFRKKLYELEYVMIKLQVEEEEDDDEQEGSFIFEYEEQSTAISSHFNSSHSNNQQSYSVELESDNSIQAFPNYSFLRQKSLYENIFQNEGWREVWKCDSEQSDQQ